MALPQGANYQAPLTASESVPELAAQGALSADDLAALLVNLLAYAATDRALADLASAGFSAAGTGNPVSPLSYLSAVRYFIQLQEDYKAVPFLLEDLLDTTLSDSPFDRDELARYLKTIPAATGESGIEPNNPGAPPRIDLAGVTFLPVSGGSLERAFTTRESGKRAFTVMIPAFSMSDREITNGMYARFLSENPYWSAENRTELVSKGLVTDEYLKMFSETADKDEPVTYISWYAAAAFCEWLNSQLAGPPAGFVVRLPYEEEFERAASLYDEAEPVFGRKNGPLGITGRKAVIGGIHDLRGNVWEWTGSWFSPYADYLIDFSEENAMGMPEGLLESFAQDGFPPPAEGIVKGGSWANTAKEITANTRGSQPAAWCTPFLGFRPVISRIQ